MSAIDVNDFTRECECAYDEDRYSVRDNGAVLRHQRTGKSARPYDNQWTFGKENSANPYLHIASVRIHRIVATAFHGEPTDPQYVVDHIDTNCRNNRPENLRWLSRLDNALKNPVTRKKIELICGSIEAFLENPSILNAYKDQKDVSWMRTVTSEEAKNARENMQFWAESDNEPTGRSFTESIFKQAINAIMNNAESRSNSIPNQNKPYVSEEYLKLSKNKELENKRKELGINNLNHHDIRHDEIYHLEDYLVEALTNNCVQKNWRVPSYFPCCPEEISLDPIESYFQNLKAGAVFSYNDKYPKSTVFYFPLFLQLASQLKKRRLKNGLH